MRCDRERVGDDGEILACLDVFQAGQRRRSLVDEDLHAVLDQRASRFSDPHLLAAADAQTFRKRLIAFLALEHSAAIDTPGEALRFELAQIAADRLVADLELIDQVLDVNALLLPQHGSDQFEPALGEAHGEALSAGDIVRATR